MQRIFAPLLLVLFTVFGCIPDLPDAFEQTYVCQSDDDCLNTQGKFFVCYKWLEALHHSGYGDSETDYSKGVCVNAENSISCSETQNCEQEEICYGSGQHNQCLNPCDAVGTTFCSRYPALECHNDRQLPGGFACIGCNDNDQCPGNHRCVATDNPAAPGICVPQCDNIGDQCAHYRGDEGHCLVLEGVKGNTTQACAPCSANSICADMNDCDFSSGGQGGYFTDALACAGNASNEKCNYDGFCGADETNCSDCDNNNTCDFDGTCEGWEYDCPDCVISCIEENPYCDDHEYCAENNGTKFCRCDCDYNTGDCDYNNDGAFMGEMCRCDADCHDAMQGCLDNPAYLDGSGFCVITEVNGDNIPTSDVMNFCGNVEGECTDINNNDGVCASVLLAEEWLESTEERNAESVCVPCPSECAGDCAYNVWDDVAYGEPANEYIRCRACDSHAECAQNPGLTFCMTIDAAPYCMFSTCTNATECGEGESCVDFGDEEKRCAPVCDDDESDSAGDDCTLPDDRGGLCNWSTKYDAEGAAETEVVCIPCFCAEGCRCLDGNCSNEARSYTDALECDYECTEHPDCFNYGSECYSCIDNICQYWSNNPGCTNGTSCVVYEYGGNSTGSTCGSCGNNDDCGEGQICRTDNGYYDCVDCEGNEHCEEGYGCVSGYNACTLECTTNAECYTGDDSCSRCEDGLCTPGQTNTTCSTNGKKCFTAEDNTTGCIQCLTDGECGQDEICTHEYQCRTTCDNNEPCSGQCVTLWRDGSPQGVCYEVLDACATKDVGSNDWESCPAGNYVAVCVNVLGWNDNEDTTLDLNDTTFSTCVECPASCSGTSEYCRAKSGSYYIDDDRVECTSQGRNEALVPGWCDNEADDDFDGAIDAADPDCFAGHCRNYEGTYSCNTEQHCITISNISSVCVDCTEDAHCGEEEYCKEVNSSQYACVECTEDTHCGDEEACQIDTYSNHCVCDVNACESNGGGGAHCYDDECTTGCNFNGNNCSGYWTCDGSQCTHNYGAYCESNAECTANDCYCGCDIIDGTCDEGCACDPHCPSGGAEQGGTCISGPETECSDILDNNDNDVSDCDDLACAGEECSILHPGKICEDSVCTAAPTGGQGCPAATPWDTEACTCPFAGNNTTNDYSNAWTGSGNSVCAYGLSADEVFIESVDGSSPEANQHDHAEPDMIVDKDGNPWIVYRDTHTNDIYLRRWDPTEGAWLYWDRMLEFWNNKFPVFPLNTREQAHDGLAMPRLTYEKIDVDVGAGTAEEVEVVAIVWAEKFICSQESYVCGDLTESICENAWQCEWDGDSCEYNQSSGQFYLPCDSDTNCPDSHTCSYNSDSTWTNTCCDVDITAQKQMVQALAFAKPAGEGTWQHKLLGYHNDYENTDDVTYTLYDPDIAIVTHGTTTNASNSVEPGDVALSYVVKSEDKSDGDDITTWKIPVSSYTFKDPSAIYACYYWKKEACSQYIGNYDSCVEQGCTWNGSSDDCYASNSSACVLSGDVEGVGEYAGSDNIAHKLEADPGICSQHVASPACATAGCYWDNDTCIILYNNVSRPDLSWSRIHIDCSSRTGAGNCNADNYCFWDAGACEAPVTGASLNDDWTYYIAWEQDGYTTSASTSVAQSGVFVRRLDPENKWGDAGNAPAGHATDESYGLSADTTQDFSQPRVRNGAYGTPRITFLNNDAQEVKGLYYKTETNTWEVASAVNDVNSSGDANLLLGTLNYETSACAHNILGWQNDCDSYTTQSECEEKGCAWNGACTEADGSSSNVQIVGHFNGAWTTMGRAKSATETSTILAQINDASGVAAELSFALGPRDTNHNQTLCAAWRNHHTTDDTYGIFAVCKDMDTNTASAGKYCCDGVGLSGECTLKGAGVVCTANYECLSNICTEGSCN